MKGPGCQCLSNADTQSHKQVEGIRQVCLSHGDLLASREHDFGVLTILWQFYCRTA